MSIREIARRVGVSPSTVSRALGNPGSVKRETLQTILKCCRKMGFTPRKYRRKNNKGGNGAAGTARQFYFLFHSVDATLSADAQMLLGGATVEARRHDAAMGIGYLNEADGGPFPRGQPRPDGLLILGADVQPQHEPLLRSIPTVLVYSGPLDARGDRVQPDNYSAGVRSLREFAGRGHTHVCAVGNFAEECSNFVTQRLAGFQMAALEQGIDCCVLRGDADYRQDRDKLVPDYCRQVVEQFLARKPRPQGIFVPGVIGGPVHRALVDHGITPMEDVGLIIDGNALVPEHLDPPPITIDVHPKDVGSLATQMLLWRLANPTAAPIRHLTRVDLVRP